MANLATELQALREEAAKFKTVRVSWLLRNLDLIAAGEAFPPRGMPPAQGSKRVKQPIPLFRFLALRGGLARCPDLKVMGLDHILVPGAGKLTRVDGGMSLDRATEVAIEARYLDDGSDINTLLEALDDEARGRPCYSENEAELVAIAAIADQEAQFRDIPF